MADRTDGLTARSMTQTIFTASTGTVRTTEDQAVILESGQKTSFSQSEDIDITESAAILSKPEMVIYVVTELLSCYYTDDADDVFCDVLAVFDSLASAIEYASLHVVELECLTGKDEVQQCRADSKEAGGGAAPEEAGDWKATTEESDSDGFRAWNVNWQHKTRVEVSRRVVHRRALDAPTRGLHHHLSDPWNCL